jgi:hypothetical protein
MLGIVKAEDRRLTGAFWVALAILFGSSVVSYFAFLPGPGFALSIELALGVSIGIAAAFGFIAFAVDRKVHRSLLELLPPKLDIPESTLDGWPER